MALEEFYKKEEEEGEEEEEGNDDRSLVSQTMLFCYRHIDPPPAPRAV